MHSFTSLQWPQAKLLLLFGRQVYIAFSLIQYFHFLKCPYYPNVKECHMERKKEHLLNSYPQYKEKALFLNGAMFFAEHR